MEARRGAGGGSGKTADVIGRLYDVVIDRKLHPKKDSYVCQLIAKGEDRVLQKMGEEAIEAILAAKSSDEDALVSEMADVVFHALVLLGLRGIPPERVAEELDRRFGRSGLAEQARRRVRE